MFSFLVILYNHYNHYNHVGMQLVFDGMLFYSAASIRTIHQQRRRPIQRYTDAHGNIYSYSNDRNCC